MWPMLLDYSKDDSKRILRRLELEAYASIISVFRAQGDLCKDKKTILEDLQQTLSISTERHRAEVRRAMNDEKLATIAENISGSMSTSEWQVEGRRLVPLMPRLVPQTAFTSTANQAASAMMEKNASLPPPVSTWNRDGPNLAVPKSARPSSPSANVVVLPSGTSIHIKGMLSQDEDEDMSQAAAAPVGASGARRGSLRSMSTDSQNAGSSVSTQTQTARVAYTTASSSVPGSSPVKITISKSVQGRPVSAQTSSQPPKVILVTSSGPASTVVQRSMSVPGSRNQPSPMSSVYQGHHHHHHGYPPHTGHHGPMSTPRPSVVGPGQQMMSPYPGVVTSTSGASVVSTTVSMPASSMGGNPALYNPALQGLGMGKVRPRIVPRQRYPAMVSPPPQPQAQKPGAVVPMGPQLASPLPQPVSAGSHPLALTSPVSGSSNTSSQQAGLGHQAHQGTQYLSAGVQVNQPLVSSSHLHTAGVQVKTLNKPTIQIKQEGMKIIAQGASSKIMPKPSQISGSGGPPVVMVNTGQGGHTGTTTSITMLPRSISTYTAHSGGKVLNITTPGGRVIATTTKASNVVTVNPKTLHLTAVKSGSVSKPNVIVVQKTQHARFQGPLGGNIRTVTTSLPGAIDKDLMGLVHHKDSQGRHVLTASGGQAVPGTVSTAASSRPGERRVIITTSGGAGDLSKPVSIIHRGRADSEGKGSSLLAELIQAAGIVPADTSVETVAQGTETYDLDNPEGEQRLSAQHQVVTTPSGQVVFRQAAATHGGAYQGRLQYHSDSEWNPGSVHDDKGSSQDSDSGTEQVFTLEQAMSMLNKEIVDLTEPDQPTTNPAVTPLSQHHQVSATPPGMTSSVLPTVVAPGQPKVSILTKSKQVGPPGTEAVGATGLVSAVSSEEGLKEGQLDTQTGLFYQVTAPPATVKVGAPQHHTVISPPPTSSVVVVAVSSTATTTTTSLSSITSTGISQSSQHHVHPQLNALSHHPSNLTATGFPQPSPHNLDLAQLTGLNAGIAPTTGLNAGIAPTIALNAGIAPTIALNAGIAPTTELNAGITPTGLNAGIAPTGLNAVITPTTGLNAGIAPTTELNAGIAPTTVQNADLVLPPKSDHIPQVLPASVTTTSPLTVISAKLPPSTVLSSAVPSLSSSSSLGLPPHQVPQTTLTSSSAAAAKGAAAAARVVASSRTSTALPTAPHLDLLSSSLAQADISFEDEEEGEEETQHEPDVPNSDDIGGVSRLVEHVGTDDSSIGGVEDPEGFASSVLGEQDRLGGTSSSFSGPIQSGESACRSGMAEVLREETAKDGTVILTVSNPASLQSELSQPVSSIPSPTPPTLVSLPLRVPAVSPTTQHSVGQLYSVLESQVAPPSSQSANPSVACSKTVLLSQTSSVLSGRPSLSPSHAVPGGLPVAVNLDGFSLEGVNNHGKQVVVPQGVVETEIHPEDFTAVGSDPDSQGDGLSVRSSKRKRKHNSGYDEPSPSPNSWVKSAASLLMKVARFKGSARDKNDIPAAEWFTYPVDPVDAPDYYTVVQNPMDFSTMRKKLEMGQYTSFEEFQSDMDLIESNCNLYNSEGTKVRQDCQEVMVYYRTELSKMHAKQNSSPVKKLKEDKSPQKQ